MKFFLFFINFSLVTIIGSFPQSYDIVFIWDSILTELDIPKNYYYESIESAISNDRVNMEVTKFENRYDDQFIDFRYILIFDNYIKTIYNSGYSLKYFLTGIEIYLDKFEKIKLLFPDYTIEQFRSDEKFGTIIEQFSDNQKLTYEIDKDKNNIVWNYITLTFLNGRINKIILTFRLE
jgi:hypothetical protein